jgi:hypothetical protein
MSSMADRGFRRNIGRFPAASASAGAKRDEQDDPKHSHRAAPKTIDRESSQDDFCFSLARIEEHPDTAAMKKDQGS